MAGSSSDVNQLREMLAARDQSKAPAAKAAADKSSVDDLQAMLGGSKAKDLRAPGAAADISLAISEAASVGKTLQPPTGALSYQELQSTANRVRRDLAAASNRFQNLPVPSAFPSPQPSSLAEPLSTRPSEPPRGAELGAQPSYSSLSRQMMGNISIRDTIRGMGAAGKSAAAILGMRDGGGDIPRPSPPFLEREELPEPDVNNNPYGSSSTNFIGLPPSQRTSKAMEFVKFWQKKDSFMNLRPAPGAWFGGKGIVAHVQHMWRSGEINPMYLAIGLVLSMLLIWNFTSPVNFYNAPRPDGMFYKHNPAYDKCVSHYQMCAKGYYEPEVTPLMMDVAALDKPGRGGPLNACTNAYAFVLLSDEYLPGVLTAVHTVRKYARKAADYVVVVTPEVSEDVRQVLLQMCVIVRETDAIRTPTPIMNQIKGLDAMDIGRKDMMTKLMVWSMDEYEKVVYLDSDLIVLRSMDELWEHTVHFGQILAPARSYSDPQNFGAYLMLLHPGVDTVKQMRDRIKFEEDVASKDDKDANHVKLHQANWVDESFLNKWFADSWLGNPDHRLPWGMIACAGDLARSPRLVLENINSTAMAFKFQGTSGTKPWLKGLVTYKDAPEQMYFQKLWWKQYYEMTDRALPSSIDMYSLLELGEYDLYWRQMFSSSKLTGRKLAEAAATAAPPQ